MATPFSRDRWMEWSQAHYSRRYCGAQTPDAEIDPNHDEEKAFKMKMCLVRGSSTEHRLRVNPSEKVLPSMQPLPAPQQQTFALSWPLKAVG